ncbi:MAG: hypothetical protein RLP14_08110 [Owenweeksia sp.]
MKNSIITVIYSHGRFGSPWYGFKIEALRPIALSLGVNMISIRYPEEMPIEKMEDKLFEVIKDDVNVPGDLVFLSSSRGAYISTRISTKVHNFFETENKKVRMDDDKVLPHRHLLGQFLIAPAFYIKPNYYPDQNPKPYTGMDTAIVQGFNDTVIDYKKTIEFAEKFKTQLFLVEGGHRLNTQREKLCMLFESFLKDCIKKSDSLFNEWIKTNPQDNTAQDDRR